MVKRLDLETLRIKLGRALYDSTFKDPGGPAWLNVPKEVQDGFIRMVGVIFNKMFEEDPVELARFFVDERLNKEEVDLIVTQARQQGKTFRMMQQENCFVQRSALFTLCEDMLKALYDLVEDTPQATLPILEQFQRYTDALEEIKVASNPKKMREKAVGLHASEKGRYGSLGKKHAAAQRQKNFDRSSAILDADGKPMEPSK
jgi:hypothetical protein